MANLLALVLIFSLGYFSGKKRTEARILQTSHIPAHIKETLLVLAEGLQTISLPPTRAVLLNQLSLLTEKHYNILMQQLKGEALTQWLHILQIHVELTKQNVFVEDKLYELRARLRLLNNELVFVPTRGD